MIIFNSPKIESSQRNSLIALNHRMAYIMLCCSCLIQITYAQPDDNIFKKIFIEIDGEEVYNIDLITQDKRGYIWMATNLGLVRYDGLEGKLYYKRKTEFSNDFIGGAIR